MKPRSEFSAAAPIAARMPDRETDGPTPPVSPGVGVSPRGRHTHAPADRSKKNAEPESAMKFTLLCGAPTSAQLPETATPLPNASSLAGAPMLAGTPRALPAAPTPLVCPQAKALPAPPPDRGPPPNQLPWTAPEVAQSAGGG